MKRMLLCCVLLSSIAFPLATFAQTPSGSSQADQPAAMAKVDINKADAPTLALALDGIGLAKAQDIVAHREKFGEFKSLDDLEQVKGIGPATIARNRDRILFNTKE